MSFIDKSFKTFLDQLYLKRPQVLTAEKKSLRLVLPFLGELSLQTRTKIQKSIKRTLGCFKVQIVSKLQTNLSNVFRFRESLTYDLVLCAVRKFQYERCSVSYYSEINRYLKLSPGVHISISTLTSKKVKLSDESLNLLFCNHDPSFDDFTILAQRTNTFL